MHPLGGGSPGLELAAAAALRRETLKPLEARMRHEMDAAWAAAREEARRGEGGGVAASGGGAAVAFTHLQVALGVLERLSQLVAELEGEVGDVSTV